MNYSKLIVPLIATTIPLIISADYPVPAAAPAQKMVRITLEISEEQAFMMMLEQGDCDGIQQLIKNDFNVNGRFANGASPLTMAILSVPVIGTKAVDLVRILIKNGARIADSATINGNVVTPESLITLLQEEISVYEKSPEFPEDQRTAIADAKNILATIKKELRRS